MVSRVHEVDFARTLQSLKETLKLEASAGTYRVL